MQSTAGRFPDIATAEAGALCPYCGTDKYVAVLLDADEWTACVMCIFRALDLPFGWNLSRSLENAIASREASRLLAPRKKS